jgi:hypothetical protein
MCRTSRSSRSRREAASRGNPRATVRARTLARRNKDAGHFHGGRYAMFLFTHFCFGFYLGAASQFAAEQIPPATTTAYAIVFAIFGMIFIGIVMSFGLRFLHNDRVGIVERLWSLKGSVDEGRVMAFNGEAGYETKILRGGIHLFKWHWRYRMRCAP